MDIASQDERWRPVAKNERARRAGPRPSSRAPGVGVRRRAITTCVAVFFVSLASCAHRYSEDPNDWVGPRGSDFESAFVVCRERMDDAPFRFRGDPRLLLLDCMDQRGWRLKDRS